MAYSYTRQSSMSDGDTITAALFNNEYNQLVNAFAYSSSAAGSTGHRHDGTAGHGGNIHTIGDLDFLNKIAVSGNTWGVFVEVSSAAVEQIRIQDGAVIPVTDNDIDLGTSSLEFKDAYFDGTVTSDAFAGPLTGDVTGNVSGTAATVTTAAQSNITSLGTLTTLTVDNVIINGTTIGHTSDTDLLTLTSGVLTVAGELDATSLDISGDADIDGTLETDALSINGTTVSATAAELNTLDGVTAVVGELNALDIGVTAIGTAVASKAVILDANKDYTGVRNLTISGELDAATLDISGDADIDGTLEADAITIAGVTLSETIADTVGAMVTSNTESGVTVAYQDADNTIDFTVGTLNQDTTGTAALATSVTVSANNSTDETVYPIFVDGATGTQGAESDTGLTYNPSTGMLTTTGVTSTFTGNITGNVTGNTSGTAATVTTAAQSNITSLGTLTALTVDNLGVNGNTITANSGALNLTPATGSAIVLDGTINVDAGVVTGATSVTSTAFVGGLTGNVTGNTSGTAATVTTAAQPNITSLGTLTTLTVDNVIINGSTIGHTGDTDLITVASGIATVAGEVSMTTLDIGGTNVTSTAAELNILDGVTSTAAELNILDGVTSTAAEINTLDAIDRGSILYGNASGVTTVLGQGTADQVLTSDGTDIAWADAASGGATSVNGLSDAKTFGTSSIMIGDATTGTIDAANYNTGVGIDIFAALTTGDGNVALGFQNLDALTTGNYNVAIGYDALSTITTGSACIAIGKEALKVNTASNNTAVGRVALTANTSGGSNTAIGDGALKTNTTAANNTAVGHEALSANTTGTPNTAVGYNAMAANTTGTNNVAVGSGALDANTTASANTAVGRDALTTATTAANNTAIGNYSQGATTTGASNTSVGSDNMASNTTGASNTSVGFSTLNANTTGTSNVAVGATALDSNTTGADNVAVGLSALGLNTTGGQNVALGENALGQNTTAANNVAVGYRTLLVNTTGAGNVAIGRGALDANTTASNNVAVGYGAASANTTATDVVAVGTNALTANTTGAINTAVGNFSLDANTTGHSNSALGGYSLTANTTGNYNVAIGRNAMAANTTASNNVAIGGNSPLDANTTGDSNVAVGSGNCLGANTTGANNVGIGNAALSLNTTASKNIGIGTAALEANTTGIQNVAIGFQSLDANTTAANNTAVGNETMSTNTTGTQNAAFGTTAMILNTTGSYNTALGPYALKVNTTGANNTAVGYEAGDSVTTGSNNVLIGNDAGSDALGSITTVSNYIMLGNNSTANAEIKVDWTVGSDQRDKTDIETLPDNAGLNFVNQMRPVSYVFDNRDKYYPHTHAQYGERDHSKKSTAKQVGFIAQEIKAIEESIGWTEDHVVNTSNEQSYKMMYSQVIPILTKAIQELAAKVQVLEDA